jgi:hypothetical protein
MDAWRLVYKTAFPVYGGSVYRLYACDINERMAALDPLICTRYALGYGYALDHMMIGRCQATAGSTTNWAEAQTIAYTNFQEFAFLAAEDRATKFGTGGSFDLGNLNKYGAQILGCTQYFTWATMPAAVQSNVVAKTVYLKFGTFWDMADSAPMRDVGVPPPYTADQATYDTFGLYTNMPNGYIHSFAVNAITGVNSYGWGEINTTNKDVLISPWCNEPLTVNAEPRTNSFTRGAQFKAKWLQAVHTNWMTKW